ncbi:MAG: transcriptional regulator [Gammaproteobacteria bacterium]|nr:transcriptional regulator [Gammaproteobacteria bacterium]
MPIYEYQCTKCGHELESLQKISDPPLTDCPECGEATLQKLVSAAGFRLKGGGWYETDFKSGSRKNVAESSSKSDGASSEKKAAGGCGSGACGCH